MVVPLRQKIKSAVVDCPVYEMTLRCPGFMRKVFGRTWVDLGNRNDRLIRSKDGQGVICNRQWSSELFPCKAFPGLARRLMKVALNQWPISFTQKEANDFESNGDGPLVSFIIGHRGEERKPLLLQTIQSVLAQKDIRLECIVVEQAAGSVFTRGELPAGVRHIHTPPPDQDMPYNRSWAFNVGVRVAAGEIVVLHDNDLLVPQHYGVEITNVMRSHEISVAQLQRFIFFLSETQTQKIIESGQLDGSLSPMRVGQNFHGGSIAVNRDTYFRIGGHDEAFIGWGGEDNEFLERCMTVPSYLYGYLPMIHLWHPYQKEKHVNDRFSINVYETKARVNPLKRIELLNQASWGSRKGPLTNVESSEHVRIKGPDRKQMRFGGT